MTVAPADEHQVEHLVEVLHHFVRLARTEEPPVLSEAADRLEVEVMVQHLPRRQRKLFAAATDYLRYIAEQRGAPPRCSVLETLSQALADED